MTAETHLRSVHEIDSAPMGAKSDDSFDPLRISNDALLQVRDQLLRLDGIGDIQMFGARDYSMRLWLDPDKIATLGMTAREVVAAIRAQNLQITGGQIAEPPISDRAFQPNLNFTDRLKDIRQFKDVVVKADSDGRTVRLRDVARIELGALSCTTNSFLLSKSAVALLVTQCPGSNALATTRNIAGVFGGITRAKCLVGLAEFERCGNSRAAAARLVI